MTSIALGILLAANTARGDSGAAPISTKTAARAGELRVVKADNVNLRARPSRAAEVVAQLKKGDEVKLLETKSVVEGGKTQQWGRVNLPASAKCYVSSKFIANGKASGDAVNIRSGPGMNFKEVGKLTKGEKVEVVKAGAEWTQIKPTTDCFGWVATDYLEAVPLTPPVAPPVIAPAPPVAAPVVEAPPVTVATPPVTAPVVSAPVAPPAPPQPATETLEYYTVKDGIFQSFEPQEKGEKPLAPYELMTIMVERRQYRIAYLDMAQKDLDKFEGKHVRILGNLRWKKGERYPVIAVDRIELVW